MAWWLFQNVVITAGLALAVAAVCRSGRIGPVGRHALWLVVLVKFVTPPLVVWPWAAPDPLRMAAPGRSADVHGPSNVVAFIGDDAVGPIDGVNQDVHGGDPLPGGTSGLIAAAGLVSMWPWLIGVWAMGSVGILAVEGTRLVRIARRARHARPADAALLQRVAIHSSRLGLRPVAVRVVPGSAPPAVWCLGRPQVLWPAELAEDASDLCVDGLLLHELAHVKRGDHLVGWIELFASVLWWWNPLFWFVRSALREQAELACDAWVISALPNGRRAYAESLLALSGAAVRGPVSMAVVGIRASSRRVLERRLAMIMKGRAPLHLTRVGLVSLAVMAAVTLPGWAAAPQDPPRPAPAVAVAATPAPAQAPAVVAAPAQTPPAPARVQTVRPQVVVAVEPQAPVPARAVTVVTPLVTPVKVQTPKPTKNLTIYVDRAGSSLPAEGQDLVKGFDADRDAIQEEAQRRIDERRQTLIKALETLQEQYAKEGKLDEAVAIRDYLRAGGPSMKVWYAIKDGATVIR
jgi:beta-lactamase regulating signal transducer with metallopeptidase domain